MAGGESVTPGKASTVARLGLYLTLADKALIARAAAVLGMSVASFVREVALREAEAALLKPATHATPRNRP